MEELAAGLSDDEALAWAVLTRTPGLQVANLTVALDTLGGALEIVRASPAVLRAAGLGAAACGYLSSRQASATDAERRWLTGAAHRVLPYNDPRFPHLLRAIDPCPIALYVAGNLEALADPQVAIVGSRNPSAQGRETASTIAECLADRGMTVTSGLAEGIDTAAHRGALTAEGVTFAVLGTGIDKVYPSANIGLAAEIQRCGGLISEFPLGSPPSKGHFPRRNRLIAGLTLGTLVVEATRRSGSLITARLANEQGRDVFAVPGSIYNPLAQGCHELIKQGAKLAETADDILRELNIPAFFAGERWARGALHSSREPAAGMDKDHKILLDALGFDTADLDSLVVRTGLKPAAVSSMMLILELEGHVQAAPGGRYSRVVNRSRR